MSNMHFDEWLALALSQADLIVFATDPYLTDLFAKIDDSREARGLPELLVPRIAPSRFEVLYPELKGRTWYLFDPPQDFPTSFVRVIKPSPGALALLNY